MRVAYICADPGIAVFGTKGASVHIQEIVRAWRARGDDVRLYCTRRGDDVPSDLADVPLTEHQVPVVKAEEREQAQYEAAEYLAAAALADGVDLVYERYSLFSTALSIIVSEAGVPGILEVNAPLIAEQRIYRSLHDEDRAVDILRQQAAAASRIACVSGPVARWAQELAPLAKDRTLVAPNGVNVSRIRPAAERGERPVVVFVGTLKPWHGVDVLIQAAAQARQDWQLRIIGDGPEAEPLHTLARQLAVDVEFTGALAPERIPAALAECSIAVAPYPATDREEQQYFSPLKIFEYCAAGLAVVASRVGQIPHILKDQSTGILVEPSNPTALRDALDTLAADPDLRHTLAAAARQDAVDSHSWDSVLTKILQGVQL